MRSKAWLPTLAALLLGLLALRAGAAEPKPYKIGDRVADFALKDATGKKIHLSQFKGKVVVINFYGFH